MRISIEKGIFHTTCSRWRRNLDLYFTDLQHLQTHFFFKSKKPNVLASTSTPIFRTNIATLSLSTHYHQPLPFSKTPAIQDKSLSPSNIHRFFHFSHQLRLPSNRGKVIAMAPSKNQNSSSNCYGENVDRQANVLASAYVVDSSARLSGYHYSTTGAGGESNQLYSLLFASINLTHLAGIQWRP